MAALFLNLFNRSIAVIWLILAVVLLRILLKKAPKWIRCALWGLVGLRLVCPFSIESIFSLVPSAQILPERILTGPSFRFDSGLPIIDGLLNEYLGNRYFEGVSVPTGYGFDRMSLYAVIWLVGLAVIFVYAAVSYLCLRRRVRVSMRWERNVWLCDDIVSPFVFGLFRPRIYLPSGMEKEPINYVLAHEKAHLQRRDHWWKPLGFLLLTVYWFSPPVWLAYWLFCRDIELACDERVIKTLGVVEKKNYSEVLLSCAVNARSITACPLAFGETGVEQRVKNVLDYKKPAFWLFTAAAMGCAVIALCFATDPAGIPITRLDADGDRSHMLENVASVVVTTGERSYGITSASAVRNATELLEDIRINPTEISKSRSEERDCTNTLMLYHDSDSASVLCFNEECTELWFNDGVKPSYTYQVKEAQPIRQFFENPPQTEITME